MGLYDRVSRIARAEINSVKSQTIGSKELERTVSTMEDAVVKTRLAIAKAPPTHPDLDILKRNLVHLETNLVRLKPYLAGVKANEQLQSTIGKLGTSSAMGAFERMEEKVLEMEARSQASYELAGNDLEQQFKLLEGGNDVDDELAAMKAQLTGGSVSQQALPASEEKTSTSGKSEVDAELEALRKQIDNL
jgi:phage shock protein A